ncbi:hypothetical protein PsorP6_014080 [Peronosclerospora sorghi]|uniref:Uncharacterized protein n=1 Tax=Peronosclerospora sorghi TaxID=230839 RepID=A0ACC0VJC4_9STRA|nr:hypothetical protein PsorP6_014080 [Peronosclerospora sorghi]
MMLQHAQRRPWWSHIEPRLILGALPLHNKDHLNQDEGVKAIVTMNQPVELLPNFLSTPVSPGTMSKRSLKDKVLIDDWQKQQVAQCFGSTEDFSPPTLDTIERFVHSSFSLFMDSNAPNAPRCVSFVHEHVDVQQQTTYVHCKAGRGRSTVIVVAFLIQCRQMTLDEAFELVKTKRPHVSLYAKQRRILREFSQKYSPSTSTIYD